MRGRWYASSPDRCLERPLPLGHRVQCSMQTLALASAHRCRSIPSMMSEPSTQLLERLKSQAIFLGQLSSSSLSRETASPSAQRPTRVSWRLEESLWTAPDTFGGTSCLQDGIASSRPNPTGSWQGSTLSPETASSYPFRRIERCHNVRADAQGAHHLRFTAEGSYNAMVQRALPSLAPEGMTIKAAPSFAEFPLYNADVQTRAASRLRSTPSPTLFE